MNQAVVYVRPADPESPHWRNLGAFYFQFEPAAGDILELTNPHTLAPMSLAVMRRILQAGGAGTCRVSLYCVPSAPIIEPSSEKTA